jgi:phosphoribosylformylglycinamidine cyclo-ligase
VSDAHSAYAASGVDYDELDRAKRAAVAVARATSGLAAARGASIDDASRGESALVLSIGDTTLSYVVEGLGTKSLIAVAYEEATGVGRYQDIAYDTVAAIVNDLICVGALPVVVNAYFATGDAAWYGVGQRLQQLVDGWGAACRDAGAVWGGGESPSLPGLVSPDGLELAGSAIGLVPPGRQAVLGQQLAAGDEIVLVRSSGLHANGASLARSLADRLPDGYRTKLPSGREFGDALLDPSLLYARLVEALIERDLPVTYMSHITGHGLRKLMRSERELSYVIEALPEVPEVLAFMADQLALDAREAYGTFNMGAGLAVYVGAGTGAQVVDAAEALGLDALVAGRVEAGPRRVVIAPHDVVYRDDELALR